jgi:hypothetical protein
VKQHALLALTTILLVTACTTPTPQEASGQRNISYKTAWFNNSPYHITYAEDKITYNVTVLSETNYDDAAPNATIKNTTLLLEVINAGGHPGVKPAFYTTPLTGTITDAEKPTTLRITDNASLNNETITLNWKP